MNDLRKFVLIVTMCVIGALTLLGLWWSYFSPKGGLGLENKPVFVEAETVRRGSIVARINVVGTLKADNEVVIHPEIEGKIKALNFKEGQLVKEGDALVEIEDSNYKAQAKDAEGVYNYSKLELERQTKLGEKAAGSGKAREKAQAEFLQAEARYEQAKLKLDHTVIRAPFTGYIGLKQFSVGALIDPRTELLTIVDVDPIKVDYSVPAKYLKSIGKGQEVKVTVDSFADKVFKATIEALDPKVNTLANSVLVRAYIPNADGRLKPGLFARVNMVVGTKDNALLLPESSVLTSGEQSFVYKIVDTKLKSTGEDVKVAIKRQVVTGMTESGVVEILEGLTENETVVSVGLSKVSEQAIVKVVEDAEAEEAFGDDLKAVESEDAQAADEEADAEPSDKTETK